MRPSPTARNISTAFNPGLSAITGVLQVDDNHIGINLGDRARDSSDVVNDSNFVMPGLDDRGANAVLIDNEDGERSRCHGCILPFAWRCATRHLPTAC
jgi:hypothetical protein